MVDAKKATIFYRANERGGHGVLPPRLLWQLLGRTSLLKAQIKGWSSKKFSRETFLNSFPSCTLIRRKQPHMGAEKAKKWEFFHLCQIFRKSKLHCEEVVVGSTVLAFSHLKNCNDDCKEFIELWHQEKKANEGFLCHLHQGSQAPYG